MSAKKLTDLHNRLAAEFVQKSICELMVNGGTYADLMLLLESVVTGCMLANVKLFKMDEARASDMAEVAVHRAMERFSAQRNKT